MANINVTADQIKNVGIPLQKHINPTTPEGRTWGNVVDEYLTAWVGTNPAVMRQLFLAYEPSNATAILMSCQQAFFEYVLQQLGAGSKGVTPH